MPKFAFAVPAPGIKQRQSNKSNNICSKAFKSPISSKITFKPNFAMNSNNDSDYSFNASLNTNFL